MSAKDIIYLLLLIVNVICAIYMGFLAWKQRKIDSHIRMAIPVFVALSVLGLTQIFHLLVSENLAFTFHHICVIVQLLCK